MEAERGQEGYRAMCGPNEWSLSGVLKDWDVRARLSEIDVPVLVVRGRLISVAPMRSRQH